jgi:anti-sigma factor RsiW
VKCCEFIEAILDYVDGLLQEESLQGFRQHCDGCPSCGCYLRTYEISIRIHCALAKVDEAEAPRALPPPLVEAILTARRQMQSGDQATA